MMGLGFFQSSIASELPGIEFGNDREVRFSELKPVELLKKIDSIKIYSFKNSQCQLSEFDIKKFELWVSNSGVIENKLKEIFDFEHFSELQILVSQFEETAPFNAFFAPPQGALKKSTLYLNCNPISKSFWLSSLSHEFVHFQYYSSQIQVENWFEEMIAQLIEREIPGQSISLSIDKLRGTRLENLNVFDTHRPLNSTESYVLSYLFGEFLVENYMELFQFKKFHSKIRNSNCQILQTTLAQFICLMRPDVENQNINRNKKDAFTENRLLINFVVRLFLNETNFEYSLDEWKGFYSKSINLHPPTDLDKGSFSVLSGDLELSQVPMQYLAIRILNLNSQWEVYSRENDTDCPTFMRPFTDVIAIRMN